jgi:NADH:ubiquinone reductase (H+-translocating)
VSGPEAAPDHPEPLAGWRWWTGLAVGGGVGLFGLAGLVVDAARTMPLVWLRWLVGLLLVHDLVLAPLVHLAGRRLRDRAPEPWRWPLQVGLVTSGVLVLASVPVLVGVGRRSQPGNASVLPGDYPLALAGVLAVVWLAVLALGAAARRRRGPARRLPELPRRDGDLRRAD